MKETVIALSQSMKLTAFGSLAFALVGGASGFFANGLTRLLCLIGFLFFGFIAVIIFSSISDHDYALKIDDDGVTDQTPLLGVGLIRWSDIRAISWDEIEGNQYLLLQVDDTKTYINRLTMPQRVSPFLLKLGTSHFQNGFLPIYLGSLAADTKSVCELINSEWEKQGMVSAPHREASAPNENHDSDVSGASRARTSVKQTPNDLKRKSDEPAKPVNSAGLSISDLDTLEKLAELRDKNILTEEEFTAKKKQIMAL